MADKKPIPAPTPRPSDNGNRDRGLGQDSAKKGNTVSFDKPVPPDRPKKG